VNRVLGRLTSPEERQAKVLVVDSDLEGSCGLKKIREKCPEVFIKSGIMERANFSACAGFGSASDGRQGVFATFAAFQEMLISEVTMARLNHSNVLCHFSHSGVDEMADGLCHFGMNNFFADNGLEEENGPKSQLFFPADVHQMGKVVDRVFWEKGLRFVYSTRSKVPELLDESGKSYFGEGYTFELGRDDFLCDTDGQYAGYIISYGDALYRCLDAVRRLRKQGLSVGLVNKCHMNVVDEEALSKIGSSGFVLCVESQSTKTGLGIRLGTWLVERGLYPKYARCGTHRESCGGTWQHAYHQGYDSESIMTKVRQLAGATKQNL
jgi:transketolase C-terminal domain/subunit